MVLFAVRLALGTRAGNAAAVVRASDRKRRAAGLMGRMGKAMLVVSLAGAAYHLVADKGEPHATQTTTVRRTEDEYAYFRLPRGFTCKRMEAFDPFDKKQKEIFEDHVARHEPVVLQLGERVFDRRSGFRWRRWMKAQDATAPDLAYLAQRVGPDATVMAKRAPYGGPTWQPERAARKQFFPCTFEDFLRDIDPANRTGGALYLGIQGLQTGQEGGWYQHEPLVHLADDFSFPTFFAEALQAAGEDVGSFSVGPNGVPRDEYGCTLWMGNPSLPSVSGTHNDAYPNLYVVLSGHKHFQIHSPNDAFFLYPEGKVLGISRDGNTAGVARVAAAADGAEGYDKEWHERASPGECNVAAGEALFLPKQFYHKVTTTGLTVAMNFWAGASPKCPGMLVEGERKKRHFDAATQSCVFDDEM